MEPSITPTPSALACDGRTKAAEDRLALLSSLLQRLEEAAQNDGLAPENLPDTHQAQLVKGRLGMASSLFTALRAKHPATANHCFRVALGVSAWAAAKNFSDELRDPLEIAALLHDVGKIGVPDSVLVKPGKLSADELIAMERSRLLGYEILSGCCAATSVIESMLYASAWFDGSKHGFDRAGDKLPLGSRMIGIVDAFDAMTSEHVYRAALSRERAVAELCECAGTQFDPTLVKEFCELVTRESGLFQSQVARRWLRDLVPDKSDVQWTLRSPLLSMGTVRRDGKFQEHLVESMCDGVVFVDAQLQVLRWNSAAERLTGITATSVIDQQWTPGLVQMRDERGRLVSDPDCPAAQTLRTGAPLLRRYSLANRKSDRISVDLQVSPVIGDNGVPCGVTMVLHDASSQTSLEERVQTLHERASHDPLTKTANRAEFIRVFPEFIDSHLKQSRPCSLIICDIDHFKKINDNFGHQAGDDALVLFASILQRQSRSGDLVVRYGGEEFVLLCSDCDNAAATRRAEEIRRRVAETPMPTLSDRSITASFGVTEIQGGDTPKTFLNRADRALLQAKDAGRNMVVQLGTGIGAESRVAATSGWFSWFRGPAGEILLERTLITVVPLKVTAEKLRGFVSDHHAQLGKVDENRVTLTIDSHFIPLIRRSTDRAVPFQVELKFDEKQLPVEGRSNHLALRTLIYVTIRPKRQRDRRRRDAIERARQILVSLKSYLMAHDHSGTDCASATESRPEGLLGSSKRMLRQWLGKNSVMSRIATTIDGFEQFLLTQLARTNQAAAESSFRIATGRKINFPSDNPSAFLQINSFENQLRLLTDVRANVTAAANIGAGLQTAMDELRTQLNSMRTALVEDEDNTLTAAEKNTNQATIDAALSEIRSLARTSIDGKRFMDGSHDYTYSGKNSTQITRLDVFSLTDDTVISGSVATAATRTTIQYTGAASSINSGAATFTLTGKRGSTTISVTNGELLTAVRDRINLDSHWTGITATASGNQLDLTTVDYGDAATITLDVTSGAFATSTITTGADAVVTINGSSISSANIDGSRVSYLSQGVNLAIDFAAGFTGAFSSVTVSDDNVARFSLTTRANERIKLALPGVFPELLGGVSGLLTSLESGGSLAGLGTNSAQAIRVVDEALAQLSMIEGRVDSFADVTVASADRLLTEFESNVEDTLETMNTVDEDAENVIVARQQALSNNTLAAIAIMQQQRSSMLDLLQMLAGLS